MNVLSRLCICVKFFLAILGIALGVGIRIE